MFNQHLSQTTKKGLLNLNQSQCHCESFAEENIAPSTDTSNSTSNGTSTDTLDDTSNCPQVIVCVLVQI